MTSQTNPHVKHLNLTADDIQKILDCQQNTKQSDDRPVRSTTALDSALQGSKKYLQWRGVGNSE